jgi:large conductance mechanosensitive channel
MPAIPPARDTGMRGIAMDPLKAVRSLDPAKTALSLVDEFKAFALKGNVIDLAVGVIIGAAFGKIIDSLVKQIIMPLIGIILPGKQGYLDWKWVINAKEVPYGLFLGEVVNFLIVALALFIFIVKFLGWLMHARKEEVAAAPPLTKDQELLAEIRDLLKRREGAA